MAKQRTKIKRQERRRRESPYLVVVCEGETEVQYFSWLRSHYRINPIRILKPPETNPKALLSYALKQRKHCAKEGIPADVWIVFDAESPQDERENRYKDVIVQAVSNQIKLANSSPCFEFWILLHFTEFINVLTPEEAKTQLAKSGRIPGYETPNLPCEKLWETAQTGIPAKRATKRRQDLETQGEDPKFARPITFVDQLVNAIVQLST